MSDRRPPSGALLARPAPAVTAPREQRCTLPDGREIILARGRRYRLTDGREVLVTATQVTADSRHGARVTIRIAWWPDVDDTPMKSELRRDRFLELVAEDLGPELPA